MPRTMLICTHAFRAKDGAEHVDVAQGERVDSDHDLVHAFPDHFVTDADYKRHEFLRSAARDSRNCEAGTEFHESRREERTPDVPAHVQEARDAGLRTIETYVRSGELSGEAADNADSVLRRDRSGLDGRYLAAVGAPAYNSAFGKMFTDPIQGHMRFTPDEHKAWAEVQATEEMRASLQTGSGAAGGLALPIVIDPSIMLTSNGALNPVRALARQITVATTEWRGVSSAGVTASYDAELSEVSDDAPTIAQPTILTETGRAFVPFSIEVGQDWSSLQADLLQVINDGRDVLDAGIFWNGNGTDQPFGIMAASGGLTTTQRIQSATTNVVALADIYSIKQALPPRFMPNATWTWHPTRLDAVYRFVAAGSTTEPQIMPDGRAGPLLGKPAYEWSAIPSAQTTTTKVALYADFKAMYTVVDRLGMTAELIPHLFGAAFRPTGSRGLYCYWRCGAKVVVPEAGRYLEVL